MAQKLLLSFSMKNQMKGKGFSLIEFLVALALFALVIISTAQLIMCSFLLKRHAELTIHLSKTASNKLEYFKSLPFESPQLQAGSGNDIIPEETSQETYQRHWIIRDVSDGLKMVEIETSAGHKPEEKLKVVLLLSRDLGF